MTYNDWITELKQNLLSVPEVERRKVLDYYAEAYADRRAAGFSEKEIIDGFGAPYDAAQAILDNDLSAEIKAENSIQVDKSQAHEPSLQLSSASTAHSPSPSPQKKAGPAKKIVLIAVTAAVAFVLVFVLPFIVVLRGCNFITKKLTKYDFGLQDYTVSAEGVDKIEIRIDYGQFIIEETYDSDVKITYPTADGITNSMEVDDNGTLKFSRSMSAKYNYANITDTIVYIPKDFAPDLDITMSAGRVVIESGAFNTLSIMVNAGEVFANSAHCNTLEVEVNAGNVQLNDITADSIDAVVNLGNLTLKCAYAESQYDATVKVDLGSCNISSKSNPNAEKTIYCNVNLGNLSVFFAD